MIIEKPACACGATMEAITVGGDVFGCRNCDSVQEQEIGDGAGARKKTTQDRRFDLEWVRRIRRYFPNQGSVTV